MAVSGTGVATIAAGTLLAYSAFTDRSIPDTLRAVLKGNVEPVGNRPAQPPAGGGSDPALTVGAGGSAIGNMLANAALRYVGRPYQWARNFDPPSGGGDCSGLVYRSYRDIGIPAPRLSSATFPLWRTMRVRGAPIPGDLLWWPGHIAIAVGDGRMVEAPTVGVPVRVVPIRKGFSAARYVPPSAPSTGRAV